MDLNLRLSSETPLTKLRRRRHLFQKILSPTDVGLKGKYVLLIPRRFARRYLPDLSHSGSKTPPKTSLCFEDPSGKHYQFRYRFEKLNNSFVLGAGWKDFVKDQKLQEGDLVCFDQMCDGKFYIHCDKYTDVHPSSTQVMRCSTKTSIMVTGSSIAAKLETSEVLSFPIETEPLATTGVAYSSHLTSTSSASSSSSTSLRERLCQDGSDKPVIHDHPEMLKISKDDGGESHSNRVLQTVKLFGVTIRCWKSVMGSEL